MVRRFKQLVGTSIVAAASGQKLGVVSDALIDHARHRLVGLVVRNGWVAAERVLPYAAVQTLGPDAVIAKSDELVDRRTWREQRVGASRASDLTGKRVVTESGRLLGTVSDVMIDERTGQVDGYDIAGRKGPLAHHSMLTRVSDVRIGPDAIVVADTAADGNVRQEHAS
jgi:uncharacterized protein YrrD